MDTTLIRRVVALLLLCAVAPAQVISPVLSGRRASSTILLSSVSSSNANSGGALSGITPQRWQHGNFATACTGGTPTPSPAGQLYATAAIASTYSGVSGCPVQSYPTVTSSGTGINAVDNGNGAGGTDSATALTDTYGATTNDSVCTGDAHHSDATLYPGLAPEPCTASGSSVFAQTTDPAHPNSSILLVSFYQSSSTTIDSAFYYYRAFYFRVVSSATVRNAEFDFNINSSTASYTACATTLAGDCGYFGWGTDYSYPVTAWRICPQNCSGWTPLRFCPLAGGSCVTTYTITPGTWYYVRQYGHRLSNCNYGSATNCYFYDYWQIAAAGSALVAYSLSDTSGNPVGGIPVNHSTWAPGPAEQEQIDRTDTNGGSGEIDVVNDTAYVIVQN
jgi:hypothetical protein